MARQPWPITLVAVVSLTRLLQVHPFSDGNGRTVRLYAGLHCFVWNPGLT